MAHARPSAPWPVFGRVGVDEREASRTDPGDRAEYAVDAECETACGNEDETPKARLLTPNCRSERG